MKKYFSIIKDKGLKWCFNRFGYFLKIKSLNLFPSLEKLYEKKIGAVKRLDVFHPLLEELKTFITELPDVAKRKIVLAADRASNGIIEAFSSIDLNYGNPVNWQINPLTGKAIDRRKKWFRISDFDKEIGDIKAIWEISRFSHFFSYSRAYLLTSDDKYYQFFSNQLNDWVRNNEYSYGANFKCGQECSIRMINVLFAYSVFKELLTEQDISNISYVVETSYRKVLSNFKYAYKCQKNNHVLSELCGMVAGAYCTEDSKVLRKAVTYLNKSIHEQFLADGGYVQQSFVYQRLAFQDLEAIITILKRANLFIDKQSADLLNASLLQMLQCMDTCGDMPNYGANDGSLIFPATSCGYRDFRPAVQSLYAILNGEKLFETGFADEEMLWFGVNKKLPRKAIEIKSSHFQQTGIFTFRKPRFWLMVVAKNKANHMDNGHFDIWANGANIFCDSGTYSYADPLGDDLLSTSAHNTIKCTNKEQLKRFGKFAFYGQPKIELLGVDENSIEFKVLFSSGYFHKRSILLSDDTITIQDESNEPFESLIHTPCRVIPGESAIESKAFRIIPNQYFSVLKAKRSLYYYRFDTISKIVIKGDCKTVTTHIKINGEE